MYIEEAYHMGKENVSTLHYKMPYTYVNNHVKKLYTSTAKPFFYSKSGID